MKLNPEAILPNMAERVIVETAEGSLLFARRVFKDGGENWHWIDDQSCVIWSPVLYWQKIVSTGATDA